MNRHSGERPTWKARLLTHLPAAILVPLSIVCAYRVQRPLRGPVFVDLGAFPGPVANANSVGVAMLVYALLVSLLLFGAARFAPGRAFHAALAVAAIGGLVLLVVVC